MKIVSDMAHNLSGDLDMVNIFFYILIEIVIYNYYVGSFLDFLGLLLY